MKSQVNIQKDLMLFEAKFGLPVSEALQGSETWMNMKLGVLSASNAHKIVAKKDSETRFTYMSELVAQVCTGIFEEINSKHLDWGNQHEDAARSCYEFATGYNCTKVPFVFKDSSFRAGCSPDSLIFEKDRGLEIKCPFNTVHFVKFLTEDKLKSEYVWQNQMQMWVTDAVVWDAVQYDPRMKTKPMHSVTVERDEKAFKTLDDAVPQFIHDMDEMLSKTGMIFGDQWKSKKAVEVAS